MPKHSLIVEHNGRILMEGRDYEVAGGSVVFTNPPVCGHPRAVAARTRRWVHEDQDGLGHRLLAWLWGRAEARAIQKYGHGDCVTIYRLSEKPQEEAWGIDR